MAEAQVLTKKRKWGTACAYKGCGYKFYSESGSDRRRFFRFPRSKAVSEIWIKNCCRDDLLGKDCKQLFNNFRLCSIHFEAEMFCNLEKKRLLLHAIPKQYEHAICPTVTTSMLATNSVASTSSCKKKCNVEEELCEERVKKIKLLQNIPAMLLDDDDNDDLLLLSLGNLVNKRRRTEVVVMNHILSVVMNRRKKLLLAAAILATSWSTIWSSSSSSSDEDYLLAESDESETSEDDESSEDEVEEDPLKIPPRKPIIPNNKPVQTTATHKSTSQQPITPRNKSDQIATKVKIIEQPQLQQPIAPKTGVKRKFVEQQDCVETCSDPLAQENLEIKVKQENLEVEFDAIGTVVSSKLRKMSSTQQLLAERLIHKIVMKGMFDELTPLSDVADVVN